MLEGSEYTTVTSLFHRSWVEYPEWIMIKSWYSDHAMISGGSEHSTSPQDLE
jgi:hypothetical protein